MNKVSLRNIIIVYISKLRDKIEKNSKNNNGIGYRRIYQ
ncbi:response regulator transcription factor [Clostridium argentinense]|nr:response regulator transcription factor [Clostridium argentinense]NFF40322.1 response regulator transcription factor [Clostridium argentinense]NFP50130.1 response regulator transcription factor [Clostridium argentinense]NFP72645.1 response regulator transcription factor [Clostridium argentinense]NFP77239.1 response regulator transcription factor [Clostridium argentinense]